jgi:hypothetical protein
LSPIGSRGLSSYDGAFMLDLRCLDDETGFIAQLDQLRIQTK